MIEVVQGWTGPIDMQLKADGVAVDLTGMTVVLILKDKDGTSVDTAGDVSILDAATGKVRYLGDPTDLVAANSPFRARWQVTDGAGRVVYFPSGPPDVWKVYAA